jgi:phosphoribosylaminoimidazolecarboxamide formyltransferase/IMP cyclohydrolase
MMDGRVKTLHPRIHGALLGVRDKKEHMEAMTEHNIEPIDLVCVNLYPFEQTIAKPNCEFADAIENIDIGGPSMLRSAAKNHKFLTVVTHADQYDQVIEEMEKNNGCVNETMREDFARLAFMRTAIYDAVIAGLFNSRQGKLMPESLAIPLLLQSPTRYGENSHQRAAFYKRLMSNETCACNATLIPGGSAMSFNNIQDTNAAFELVKEFDEPAATVIKHMNPCGFATDENIMTAYRKAYEGDVISAFGSIIALNRRVNADLARLIMESYKRIGQKLGAGGFFAEVIIAPDFTARAVEIIREMKNWGQNVRLLKTGPIVRENTKMQELDIRSIAGGILVQQRDTVGWEPEALTYPTRVKPTKKELEDLKVAWLVAKHTKSNTIVLAKDGKVWGVGAGQMNRVIAGKIAITHAGDEAVNCVMGSDAFLPFPDNVVNAAKVGVTCIVQPGGSKKDQDVIECANNNEIAMVFTGKRHFKH